MVCSKLVPQPAGASLPVLPGQSFHSCCSQGLYGGDSFAGGAAVTRPRELLRGSE